MTLNPLTRDVITMLQLQCMNISKVCERHAQGIELMTSSRAIVSMLGCDLGPPRLPLTPFDKDKWSALENDLRDLQLLPF